jgi:hypothetical protein
MVASVIFYKVLLSFLERSLEYLDKQAILKLFFKDVSSSYHFSPNKQPFLE